jgi:penicillin G amidase
MFKKTLTTALIAALLGVSTLAAAQTISGPGLKAAGSISYDAEGVPTVIASSDEDAAYLLGYAHARDRFFQMDYLRHVGSGTYAELVGSAALASDVQLRTLGLRRSAWATYIETNAKLRGMVQAYANGVNAWLAHNPLPVEYGALELTRVDPWSPVDTFVIGKLLTFQLGFDDDTGLTVRLGTYQQAGVAGGFDGTKLFFDDTHRVKPADGRITAPDFLGGIGVGEAEKSAAEGVPMVDPATLAAAQQHVDAVKDNPWLAPLLELSAKRGGSNWWLIGASKTVDGKPLLANDPHLAMDMPALWTEAHMVSTDPQFPQPLDVVGVSVPGTPSVLLGCTTHHCWGQTVNPMDMTDAYSEKFRLNTYGLPTHTIHSGVAEPVVWIFQSYFVNNLGDQIANNVTRSSAIGYTNGGVTIIVPRRNNGPVVSITGDTGISFAYTGWGATQELETYRRIARAQNLAEFREALTYFDGASQNFGYADIEGNVAYTAPGELPLRTDLQTLGRADGGISPLFVRDGTGALKHDWMPKTTSQANQVTPYELLPIAEMPALTNPASGYIANSNNDPVGTTLDNNAFNQNRAGGGIYYLNARYADFRMGRVDRLIRAKLDANQPVSMNDLRTWQANNQPLDAELLRPALLTAFDNAGASGAWSQLAALGADPAVVEAVLRIRDWDLSTPTGIREGYDPGDNPANLPEPSASEVSNSVAATLYTMWRNQTVRNVLDATLTRVGLGSQLPGNEESLRAIINLFNTFPTMHGRGKSGLDFFAVTGAPSAEAARDYLLLKSLKDGLNLLASAEFAPAYAQSTDQNTYRWGRLHRKVFRHPLGEPFNIPGANPFPITNLSPSLPGVARPGNYEVVDDSDVSVRANTVNGFMFGSGPVRRFVGSMQTPIVAQQIYPGGQSGSLLSPAYISQLPRWLVNAYKPLVIGRDAAVAGEIARLNFTP